MSYWMKCSFLTVILTILIVTTAVQADASVDKSGNNPASGLALLFDQDLGDDSPILLAQRPWRRGPGYRRYPPRRHWGYRGYGPPPPRRHWGYHRGWGPPPPHRRHWGHRRGWGPPPPRW